MRFRSDAFGGGDRRADSDVRHAAKPVITDPDPGRVYAEGGDEEADDGEHQED